MLFQVIIESTSCLHGEWINTHSVVSTHTVVWIIRVIDALSIAEISSLQHPFLAAC